MEATSKAQIKVGIFVVFGIMLIMFSIFMIGGDASMFSRQVRLHAHFDSVQGLAEGSVVSLSGVNIGNIEKINFVSEINELDVVMKIDEKYLPRVRQGTLVEIRTQGALGDKFIFLVPADPKNPVAKDGEVLSVAKAMDIFSVVADHGKDTEKVFGIINEIYRMTKTINDEGRLEKLMSNLTSASSNLKDFSSQARQIMSGLGDDGGQRLRHSLDRMDSVLAKIDRGDGTLGALINDSTVHEQLKAMLGGSNRGQTIKSMIRTSIEKSQSGK